VEGFLVGLLVEGLFVVGNLVVRAGRGSVGFFVGFSVGVRIGLLGLGVVGLRVGLDVDGL